MEMLGTRSIWIWKAEPTGCPEVLEVEGERKRKAMMAPWFWKRAEDEDAVH